MIYTLWKLDVCSVLINVFVYCSFVSVTPLDVVKTRLQAQHKTMLSDKCFVYCNGLMDHLCPCYPGQTGGSGLIGNIPKPSTYTGTIVKTIHFFISKLCVINEKK